MAVSTTSILSGHLNHNMDIDYFFVLEVFIAWWLACHIPVQYVSVAQSPMLGVLRTCLILRRSEARLHIMGNA